jgi:hypothetical protein
MGTFGTIFDIGHASGPIVAGFLLVRFDYFYSFLLVSVILVCSIPVFLMAVKAPSMEKTIERKQEGGR